MMDRLSRILLVEDIPSARCQLEKLLSEQITGAVIDSAETVDAGAALIDQSRACRRPYHVAILDFKLPQKRGEEPKVDETLCQMIQSIRRPGTLIMHITAYSREDQILRHLGRCHAGPEAVAGCYVSKLKAGWSAEVVSTIRTYLAESRIRPELEAIFGREDIADSDWIPPFRSTSTVQGSLTFRLADLNSDIEANWDYLGGDLQDKIRRILRVHEDRRPVRVSLI